MVLLDPFEDRVLLLLERFPDGRVEDLLLDGGVDRELLDHLVHDVPPGLVGSGAGLLELLEETFDVAVVLTEKGDGVHGDDSPRGRAPGNSRPFSGTRRSPRR